VNGFEPDAEANLADAVRARATADPDAPALIVGDASLADQALSWRALDGQVDACAAGLLALGLPAGALVVGAVSRLAWKKAIAHLVQATPRIVEALPQAHVVIAGDGPLRAELEGEAAALGVADRVRFLGSREDSIELMAAFDVFVLPSVVEGMSNALIEAMAVGRPVVATDVGGNSEVVADGETGFLVPPSAPDQLAAAIVKLLGAPEMAAEMGAAGRRRVIEHYRVDVMTRRIEAMYDALLREKAA